MERGAPEDGDAGVVVWVWPAVATMTASAATATTATARDMPRTISLQSQAPEKRRGPGYPGPRLCCNYSLLSDYQLYRTRAVMAWMSCGLRPFWVCDTPTAPPLADVVRCVARALPAIMYEPTTSNATFGTKRHWKPRLSSVPR